MHLLVPGVEKTDVAKLIMVSYRHNRKIFQITTAVTVHMAAPMLLDFGATHPRHGRLQYHLRYVIEYQAAPVKDQTKSIYSCTIEPRGTDVDLCINESGRNEIKQYFTEAITNIGFTVTRADWAKSANLGQPLAKMYADLAPTAEPVAALFYKFKEIRGPSGTKMLVKFQPGLTDTYTALCPKCLTDKKHQCICNEHPSKRPISYTTEEKAEKKARNMARFEEAFD
jgi:hypothetical protein